MITPPSTHDEMMATRVENALLLLNKRLVYLKTMKEYAEDTPCSSDSDVLKKVTLKFFNKKIRDFEASIRDLEIVRDHLANE